MESEKPTNFPALLNYIDRLENRIKRLEEHLKLETMVFDDVLVSTEMEKSTKEDKNIQLQIHWGITFIGSVY